MYHFQTREVAVNAARVKQYVRPARCALQAGRIFRGRQDGILPRTVTGSIAASNTAGSSISVTEGQPVRAQATGWTSGGVLVQTSLDGGTTWATEAVLAVGTSGLYEGSAGVAQLVRCRSDSCSAARRPIACRPAAWRSGEMYALPLTIDPRARPAERQHARAVRWHPGRAGQGVRSTPSLPRRRGHAQCPVFYSWLRAIPAARGLRVGARAAGARDC